MGWLSFGFLLGGIYAFSVSVGYGALADISMLGCVARAMLLGYIAEAINKDYIHAPQQPHLDRMQKTLTLLIPQAPKS